MVKIDLDKLLNKIIIILCVIIVISTFRFLLKYKDTAWNYQADSDVYLSYISEQRYSELPRVLYSNYYVNPKGDLKNCIAVASYYKNTSYYKMYKEVGNIDKANKHLTLMGEDIENMGDLSFTADNINKDFAVDPALSFD